MRDLTLKIISVVLLCATCLAVLGCGQERGDYCRINRRDIYFLTDEEKYEYYEPLEELIERGFALLDEREPLDEVVRFDQDEAAIASGYSCALFDVTQDGVPELLVHAYGFHGSSGTATYYVYDIFSGEKLGEMSGGNGEDWCLYYDVGADKTIPVGQYWLRGGWTWRGRFITTVGYDLSTLEYVESIRFHTEHEIAMKDADTMQEIYPETTYYVDGKEVSLDEYYYEYGNFMQALVRIPGTELIVIRWGDVTDNDDTAAAKAEKMAEALVSSAQKFLKP